ncbi:hypothetical protein [Novosphingobium acidiphilum]|uniref:hypothetical protein n=1 Tax=Novosphingobium acidiphilum TaxID=505248 RepID=UPI0012EB8CF9|nr:hypothetical protein [Novosphingobium acidiphilum]
MRRQDKTRARQNLDRWAITPGTLVLGARMAVPAIGALAAGSFLRGLLDETQAVQIALALGLLVLIAAPRQRGVELLGMVAIWMTVCEFLAASRTGHFALWRWAMVLASLALILMAIRVAQLRARARINPWRPLHERGVDDGDHPPAARAVIEGRARPIAR